LWTLKDGYHYSIAGLRNFPDPDAAIYRRGAPDTFDAESLLTDLRRIRNGEEEVISLPGFDHAVGDPEPGAHSYHRDQHRIVICEGLYLLHNADGWEEISDCFDLTIFVDANLDLCMERLKIRNACIPGYTLEEIAFRVDAIDRKNAITVGQGRDRAHIVHRSVAYRASL
jgi:pantothenate kinase